MRASPETTYSRDVTDTEASGPGTSSMYQQQTPTTCSQNTGGLIANTAVIAFWRSSRAQSMLSGARCVQEAPAGSLKARQVVGQRGDLVFAERERDLRHGRHSAT
jgi:hypothetical protein